MAGVLDIVLRESARKSGRQVDEDQAEAQKAMLKQMVDRTSDVYYTSSHCLDDGIIDPRDTRNVLGLCLSFIYSQPLKGGNLFGISRM